MLVEDEEAVDGEVLARAWGGVEGWYVPRYRVTAYHLLLYHLLLRTSSACSWRHSQP